MQILKAGRPLGQFFTLQYAGKDANGVSQYVDVAGKLTTTPTIGVDYHYLGCRKLPVEVPHREGQGYRRHKKLLF